MDERKERFVFSKMIKVGVIVGADSFITCKLLVFILIQRTQIEDFEIRRRNNQLVESLMNPKTFISN